MEPKTEKIQERRSRWSTGGRMVGISLLGILGWFLAGGLVEMLSDVASAGPESGLIQVLRLILPPVLGSFLFTFISRPPIRWQHGVYFGIGLCVVLFGTGIATSNVGWAWRDSPRTILAVALYALLGGVGGQLAQATGLAMCGRDGRRVRRVKRWHLATGIPVVILVALMVAAVLGVPAE